MNEDACRKLAVKGVRMTPQRIAVMEAVMQLKNHPTAENIIDYIHETNPTISVATVYRTLEFFKKEGLIRVFTSDKGVMRHDAVTESHHHIYCTDSEEILDYFDPELTNLLKDYFRKKGIEGFNIEEIKLQIQGRFRDPV